MIVNLTSTLMALFTINSLVYYIVSFLDVSSASFQQTYTIQDKAIIKVT